MGGDALRELRRSAHAHVRSVRSEVRPPDLIVDLDGLFELWGDERFESPLVRPCAFQVIGHYLGRCVRLAQPPTDEDCKRVQERVEKVIADLRKFTGRAW